MRTDLSEILVHAPRVTLDVNGVGYEVLIPLSSFDKLPAPGGEVRLLTHLAVREDAHVLYGFMSAAERELFRLLINTVSGIGPKIALNVLSGMNPVAFRGAVASGDVKSLSQISGVGKKTAERLLLELKDKLDVVVVSTATTAAAGASSDVLNALLALGYSEKDSKQKTLRKPKEQLKQFVVLGKPAARKFMDNIKTSEIKMNGRFNEHTLILRAYK